MDTLTEVISGLKGFIKQSVAEGDIDANDAKIMRAGLKRLAQAAKDKPKATRVALAVNMIWAYCDSNDLEAFLIYPTLNTGWPDDAHEVASLEGGIDHLASMSDEDMKQVFVQAQAAAAIGAEHSSDMLIELLSGKSQGEEDDLDFDDEEDDIDDVDEY